MDVPAVRDIAKTLGIVSDVLNVICTILEAISAALKATAFIGLVGNAVAIQFIDRIKPQIQQVAEKCGELSKDVDASADAYERGDEIGAARFH
jgi:hypothetical protein